jgi:hypothetical protein
MTDQGSAFDYYAGYNAVSVSFIYWVHGWYLELTKTVGRAHVDIHHILLHLHMSLMITRLLPTMLARPWSTLFCLQYGLGTLANRLIPQVILAMVLVYYVRHFKSQMDDGRLPTVLVFIELPVAVYKIQIQYAITLSCGTLCRCKVCSPFNFTLVDSNECLLLVRPRRCCLPQSISIRCSSHSATEPYAVSKRSKCHTKHCVFGQSSEPSWSTNMDRSQ